MPRTVKCGLIQCTNAAPTDAPIEEIKRLNIEKHLGFIEQAAKQGVQIICMQEVFTTPYFCAEQQTRWYEAVERVPDGPTVRLMQDVAKRHSMVLIVPIYEEEQAGVYYNTAAVIDADGKYLGKYRKTHIPHVAPGFWEKFYFRPGNLGYPTFDTAVGRIGVYICYDRHFPEGWRALGLAGAKIVFNPPATSRGLSSYLWQLEQPASAVANEYYIGAINRVGIEPLGDNDFYGGSYFVDPEGKFVGDVGDTHKAELIVRDLDLSLLGTVRDRWQFYRDRRPDSYRGLVQP